MRDVVCSCRLCTFSQVNVSWLAFMQGPSSTYKEAGGVWRGDSLKIVCRLCLTAATIGRMSDLALLSCLACYTLT